MMDANMINIIKNNKKYISYKDIRYFKFEKIKA